MSEQIESITKLDAARRQLSAAIDLFFHRGDVVAVHTIAAAAQDILRDLGKAKGVGSFLKDNPAIRPEKQKEVIEIFNTAQNFFKHADRDPDGVLEFRPTAIPFQILDAVLLHGQLTGSRFPMAHFFLMWFALKYPDVTMGPLRALVAEARKAGIDPDDFELLQVALQQWRQQNAVA